MANHFASLGLPVDSQEALLAMAEFAAHAGSAVETPHGYYIYWSPDEHINLWVQASRAREIIGCLPHFFGPAQLVFRLEGVIRDDNNDLDGSLKGWVLSQKDSTEAGLYPLRVDVPNFDAHANELKPSSIHLQVAAFPSTLEIFPHAEARASSDGPFAKLAEQAVIPTGLFKPDGTPRVPEQSEAIISGTILELERRKNPVTHAEFYHFLVQSYGATFDVVAEPQMVSAEPQPGYVLAGVFWLSARLLDA